MIEKGAIIPPFIPELKDPYDTRYFPKSTDIDYAKLKVKRIRETENYNVSISSEDLFKEF